MAHNIRLHYTPHRSLCNSLFAYTVKNMRWIESYHIASSSVFGRSGDVSNGFLSFLSGQRTNKTCIWYFLWLWPAVLVIRTRQRLQLSSYFVVQSKSLHYSIIYYYKITARIRILVYVTTAGFFFQLYRQVEMTRARTLEMNCSRATHSHRLVTFSNLVI